MSKKELLGYFVDWLIEDQDISYVYDISLETIYDFLDHINTLKTEINE